MLSILTRRHKHTRTLTKTHPYFDSFSAMFQSEHASIVFTLSSRLLPRRAPNSFCQLGAKPLPVAISGDEAGEVCENEDRGADTETRAASTLRGPGMDRVSNVGGAAGATGSTLTIVGAKFCVNVGALLLNDDGADGAKVPTG